MSEKLPYENQLQQQWTDLPLPDMNAAWADMERRLEEDDDRTPIAWWRRGCALWGLLLLVLLGAGWWWLQPQQWFAGTKQDKPVTEQPTKNVTGNSNNNNNNEESRSVTNNTSTSNTTGYPSQSTVPGQIDTNDISKQKDNDVSGKQLATDPRTKPPNGKSNSTTTNDTPGNKTVTDPVSGKKTIVTKNNNGQQRPRVRKTSYDKMVSDVTSPGKGKNTKPGNNKTQTVVTPPSTTINQPPATSKTINTGTPPMDKSVVATIDSSTTSQTVATQKKDSVKKAVKPKQDTVATKPAANKKPKEKSSPFLSGGIAMQQQIPLGGQKLTPYSSSGRKGSLLDYIPSVYLRLNKRDWNDKDKWFIQGEFKYGAPQYSKKPNEVYDIKTDTIIPQQQFNRTSFKLKKTFYHQVPVTFNYYIAPDFSIGTGIIFNKFVNAVSERAVTSVNLVNQDSTRTSGIISGKK